MGMVMPGRRQSVQPGLCNILQSQETKMMLQDIELSDSEDEGDFVNNKSEPGSHRSSRLPRKSLLVVTERSPSIEQSKGNRRRTRDSLGSDSFDSRRVGSLICGFCKPSNRAGSLICGFRNSSTCSTRSSIVDG